MPLPLEIIKGIVGGKLMGIGAAVAESFNVCGFYAATCALSLTVLP
jgi:hypothetical protein